MRRLTARDYAVDAVTAAKTLVGAWLCRRLEDGTVVRRRITETEAYCGEEDTACHAHKGRTARTDVMYSPGGCAYIYLCYGMHEMLNVVTGPEGRPEAVLIRGVDGELLIGSLPQKQMKILVGWLAFHEEEVYAAWELAVQGKHFEKIVAKI